MIGTQFSFKKLHTLLEAQLLHHVPYIASDLTVEHLSSVFRGENDVVFAVPGRMSQFITLFNHSKI